MLTACARGKKRARNRVYCARSSSLSPPCFLSDISGWSLSLVGSPPRPTGNRATRSRRLLAAVAELGVPSAPIDRNNDNDNDPYAPNHEPPPCPCCGGRMKIIETFNGPRSRPYHVRRLDAL
jgi:hypothetical protein